MNSAYVLVELYIKEGKTEINRVFVSSERHPTQSSKHVILEWFSAMQINYRMARYTVIKQLANYSSDNCSYKKLLSYLDDDLKIEIERLVNKK